MDYTLNIEESFKKITLHIKLLFIPFKANNFSPKFLQSNILLYLVVCLLVIKIISIVIFVNFPKNIFFANITKTTLVNLINQERSSLGIRPLTENQKLNEAASLKAKDILEKDYFSHQSPEGATPWYWFSKIGYNYKYAGENLAIGFLNSEDVYKAWVNSISHKENIINPNYKEIGTAVLTGDYEGNNMTVIVQFFGSPKITNISMIKERTKPTKSELIVSINENQLKLVEEENTTNNVKIEEEILSQSTDTTLRKDGIVYYKFLNFIFYDSNRVFEYIIYFLLTLTGVSLLINILINFNIQDRRLIVRSFIIIILLFAAVLLSKEIMNLIITYEITI